MSQEDAKLIQRTLEGDDRAFGFLVDKYKSAVCALAFRKVGNYHDAQDIAQEAFIKAYRALPTLKQCENFAGWLYTITANCARSWLRKNRRRMEENMPLSEADGELAALSMNVYADKSTRESVRDAVNTLAEGERLVVTLYYVSGLSIREIAEYIGTSMSAVKMRLHRAKQHLREELTTMQTEIQTQPIHRSFTFDVLRRLRPDEFTPQARIEPTWFGPIGATLLALLAVGLGLLQHSSQRQQRPTQRIAERFSVVPIDIVEPSAQTGLSQPAPSESTYTVQAIVKADDDHKSAKGQGAGGEVVVSGRVISLETGQPLANAEVLRWQKKTPAVRTDSDGRYRIAMSEWDEGGEYIWFRHSDYAIELRYLDAARPKTYKDFDVTLAPGVTASGRIVDSEGKPVAGATIRVSMYSSVPFEVQSDADGRFTFHGLSLKLSEQVLWISHPDFKQITKVVKLTHGGSVELGDVSMGKRRQSGEFALTPQEEDMTYVTVRGVVRDIDGKAIAGARVSAGGGPRLPPGVPAERIFPIRMRVQRIAGDAYSDANGVYELQTPLNHPLGEIRFLVGAADGYAPQWRDIELPQSGEVNGFDFQLAVGNELRGRVVDENSKPVVSAAAGWPMWKGWRLFRTVPEKPDVLSPQVVRTDATGEFTLTDLPTGDVEVTVLADGYERLEEQPATPGQLNTFTLLPAAHLTGTVIDASNGMPIQRFTIRFLPSESAGGRGLPLSSDDVELGRVFDSPEGIFVGSDAPDGAISHVQILADGYVPAFFTDVTHQRGMQPEDFVVKLQRARTVPGQIVDTDTGNPVAGARLVRFSRDNPLWKVEPYFQRYTLGHTHTQSLSDGRFVLSDVGETGHFLYIEHGEYAPQVISLDDTGSTLPPIRLTQGATLKGQLWDQDEPFAEQEVTLTLRSPFDETATQPTEPGVAFAWGKKLKTDVEGRFSANHLPPGHYWVSGDMWFIEQEFARALFGEIGLTDGQVREVEYRR
ncbi:sigma-70 family RNA polymerase sigma factor [Candidatus Poribacteria bacterium]|nr:sigma-70 family RNA polymerase sigma factor [Candidatus Poribacteria bacterium]